MRMSASRVGPRPLRVAALALLAAMAAMLSAACRDATLGAGVGRDSSQPTENVRSLDASIAPSGKSATDADARTDGGENVDEQRLPPLATEAALVSLSVPGFGDAVVSLPAGARTRKPVMFAVHGNYDSPDFQCGTWRAMVKNRGFILCPRGVPRPDSPAPDDIRYTYEGRFAPELDAALAALQQRYGAWIDPGPMIYVGFSLGAILARGYVMRAPSRFTRMILIEGGASGWDATAMSKAGVARMLWACGQSPCVDAGRAAAAAFERAKVASKVVSAKGAGHTYGGPVADAIRAEWEWLVGGDPRWSP